MGCGGSAGVDISIRLDAVQEGLKDHKTGKGDVELNRIDEAATELKNVFNKLVAEGAKNAVLLDRVQILSEDVLGNLESRITSELLQRSDSKAIVSRILKIAKSLDTFRATKATSLLEDKLDTVEQDVCQANHQEVVAALKQITAPNKLSECMPKALENLEIIVKRGFTSKKVAEMLLKVCEQMSKCLQAMVPKCVAEQPSAIKSGLQLGTRLDSASASIAGVHGTSWDPVQPKLVTIVNGVVVQTLDQFMNRIEAELSKGLGMNPATVKQGLTALIPWWVDAGGNKLQSHRFRLTNIIKQVNVFCVETVQDAASKSQTTKCDQIVAYGADIDDLCEKLGFDADDGTKLHAKLEGACKSYASKAHLDFLTATLAEENAGKVGELSKAFEELVKVWPEASQDESSVTRLQEIFASLDTWISKMSAAAAENKEVQTLRTLENFADEFERLRPQFCPPDTTGDGLKAILYSAIAQHYLAEAERELAKEGTVNPTLLIATLKQLSEFPQAVASEDVSARVASVFEKITQRMSDGVKAKIGQKDGDPNTGGDKALAFLYKFAGEFDKLRGTLCTDAPAETSITSSLAQVEVCEYLQTIEAELAKESGLNSALVQQMLQDIVAVWPKLGAAESLGERLNASFRLVRRRMIDSMDEALASKNQKKMEALLTWAEHCDAVTGVLKDVMEGGGELKKDLEQMKEEEEKKGS